MGPKKTGYGPTTHSQRRTTTYLEHDHLERFSQDQATWIPLMHGTNVTIMTSSVKLFDPSLIHLTGRRPTSR